MNNNLNNLISKLKHIQADFYRVHGINDIISNSKVFEVLIANSLGHILIPGHSGSRDAKDEEGEFEYKHYKESSSNHTWTFNDYSDETIRKLKSIKMVIFAHINDNQFPPIFDWYYGVAGKTISEYLYTKTKPIKNVRKMVNISPSQIEKELLIQRIIVNQKTDGKYKKWLDQIFTIIQKIEKKIDTHGILTSNKFWEILVAIIIGHKALSDQGAYDAIDKEGNYYEYKVSKTKSWNFEDISNKVLNKFRKTKLILLAVVDKENFLIKEIYSIKPGLTIKRLKNKLMEKKKRYSVQGKQIRRLQVSLSAGDLKVCGAKLIYHYEK